VTVAHLDSVGADGEPRVAIGVIATPPAAAQVVADRLVAAGVRAILNFAPGLITVGDDVIVRKVDLASELQVLSYYHHRDVAPAPMGNCPESIATRCADDTTPAPPTTS